MLDPENIFKQRLDQAAAETETLLDRLMLPVPLSGEIARPPRLLEVMRYASLGGGKRFRPFLVVETAALFGVDRQRALMVGAALELIHCYSLVHDDLPAMDNDDLRRGRPTAHKAYDEASAILAADAHQTLAFDILARPETHPDAGIRIALVSALARASGLGGMVGGQILDLAAEGRFNGGAPQKLDEDGIRTLQGMKTGALLRFACVAGAILGKANADQRASLERYGGIIGEAFQIADDILDVEGDTTTLGKATGKDSAANKATLVSMLGVGKAKERLKALVDEAERRLESFGSAADILKSAARFVAERRA